MLPAFLSRGQGCNIVAVGILSQHNLVTTTMYPPPSPPPPRPQKSIRGKMRAVYTRVGFTKGYNFLLWLVCTGGLLGFCLARLMYLDYRGIFCAPHHASPGECYRYATRGAYQVGIQLHLYAMVPAGMLACVQFVPVVRHRLMLVHRINGYVTLLLGLAGVAGAIMIIPVAFGGDLAIRGSLGLAATMFVGSLSLAYYYIKRRRIDQHRAWMLRAWSYVSFVEQLNTIQLGGLITGWHKAGSIVTVRFIILIAAVIISTDSGQGSFFQPKVCRELASYLNSTVLLQRYPDCKSLDAWVLVKPGYTPERPEQVAAAVGLSSGLATWMAFSIHAVCVELYVRCNNFSGLFRSVVAFSGTNVILSCNLHPARRGASASYPSSARRRLVRKKLRLIKPVVPTAAGIMFNPLLKTPNLALNDGVRNKWMELGLLPSHSNTFQDSSSSFF